MFDLTGKTALVTGATGGIGAAIARALHGRGATVAISGTRAEVLEALKAELGERVHVPGLQSGQSGKRSKSWFRRPKPRWARSIFWSTMPASRATAWRCA